MIDLLTKILPFLIVCPMVFLAGFIDAIGGGGGLISLPAYLLAGVPPHVAIGSNKFSSAIGTGISTTRFLKNGYVKIKLAILSALFALAGSAIGARISLMVSEDALKLMMLIILPIVAYFVLKNKHLGDNETTLTRSKASVLIISLLAAFFIGMYDGFYGPGTGTFLLLVFVGVAFMDVKTAAGHTKVINLSSNIAALVTFIINGNIHYPLAGAAALFSIAGHYVGSGLVLKNGQKIVRPIIFVVLGLLVLKILTEYIEFFPIFQ